ncbi:MAG TPA: Phenylacetic acid catabolic protein [Candidatus Limnocylindria bacterium]|nr:Phenylacetic acid catabolic protein [Candidatus Limnocylindria bacterium]
MIKISTFDDWIDYFHEWQKDIGYESALLGDYKFETKLGELHSQEIEFGDFKGQPKWQRVGQIPNQSVRDALMNLIVYQGDTEFASVEQQKNLLDTAPTEYDRQALVRVNSEEMRHGWQMCYLLVNHFGDSGKLEARKMLERRAFRGDRLLGSFNAPVNNWLDFFTYTEFVDRDGKYQLTMLSHSAFAPLAESVTAMLKEEFFHMFTGHSGLTRILRAGKIPVPIVQKYFNKWLSTAYDLFGTDHSSSAHWAYTWGLKGRYDEHEAAVPAEKDKLNDLARTHYMAESAKLIDQLNQLIPAGQPKLYAPDLKFNRSIGENVGKTYSVTGELLTPEAYKNHVSDVLPTAEDEKVLAEIINGKDWVAQIQMN